MGGPFEFRRPGGVSFNRIAMDSSRAQRHPPRGAALLCLAALLCSLTWVRVVGVTAIAVLDQSHEAQLSQPDGQWRLVLKHQAGPEAQHLRVDQSPDHQHPLGAALLMFLARDGAPNQDHVLGLGAVGEVLLDSAEGFRTRSIPTGEIPAFAAVAWNPLRHDSVVQVRSRPPPVPETVSLPLTQVRTTVLLI